MKKYIAIALLSGAFLTSCGEYNRVLKSADYEYKYEAAKEYFVKGQYAKAAVLLADMVTMLKGTLRAEESLYMLAMSEYCDGNYDRCYAGVPEVYLSDPGSDSDRTGDRSGADFHYLHGIWICAEDSYRCTDVLFPDCNQFQ